MDGKRGNGLLTLFIGVLLLGAGLFMIMSKVSITSSFGLFRIGGLGIPFGLITVPLFIGIIWMFVKPNTILPKVVIVLGVLIIIVSIIMSIRMYFARTSLYEYVLMFGMSAAGAGLIIRALFATDKSSKK